MRKEEIYDAVVIGGGFYGAAIAIHLAKQHKMRRVILIEKENDLLTRASYCNQARVHNGYHYPRSFTTAFRSRINYPKFIRDWPEAVKQDFTKIYAIAKRNSKVTSRQFARFADEIGAKIKPASPSLKKIFEQKLIENVFEVEEIAFDTTKLAEWARKELKEIGVQVKLSTTATDISKNHNGNLTVDATGPNSHNERINTRYVFNCTYSGTNHINSNLIRSAFTLKNEITEMGLIRLPDNLKDLGITVMDGPFFSIMPFPARELHTLSHVRYTPHFSWEDDPSIDPYQALKEYDKISRVDRMLRDVSRYIPSATKATHVDSLFEIKTVLTKNEGDDGRPILFEKNINLPGYYSILGGKIDNIYDVLERLDSEKLIVKE